MLFSFAGQDHEQVRVAVRCATLIIHHVRTDCIFIFLAGLKRTQEMTTCDLECRVAMCVSLRQSSLEVCKARNLTKKKQRWDREDLVV